MKDSQPTPPVICTIIAQNYLDRARLLTDSFLAQHPRGRVFVLSVDGWKQAPPSDADRFTRVDAAALRIPHFKQMAFRYDVTELSTAVKPFWLKFLFARYDLTRLLYFDPDICFYQPFHPLWRALDEYDAVLTPHLLAPLDAGELPSELDILKSGVYNLGFIGLKKTARVDTLLDWWGERLEKECLHDTARGYFVDQRWADLIPAYCPRTHIWRDETYNVAYWNLSQRKLACEKGTWRINGKPLTFFHFSGYKPDTPTQLSTHFKRALPTDTPALTELLREYGNALRARGYTEVKGIPYGHSTFSDGTPIPIEARRMWRDLHGEQHWSRPFRVDDKTSYFAWLNTDESPRTASEPLVTNLMLELYRLRSDVNTLWHEPLGKDRAAVVNWYLNSGAHEHRLPEPFIAPVRASVPALEEQACTERTELVPPPAPPRTFKRRVYYAVRNPLHAMGLHRIVRTVLGEPLTNRIHNSMTMGPARHPVREQTRG